jgi:dGTPase
MDPLDRGWLETSLGAQGPPGCRLASPVSAGAGLALRPSAGAWKADIDRLEQSATLQRLAGICQVFEGGAPSADRLSHSREVSVIAGHLADRLGVDADLAAAIGLAHDCGHAPAGHVGELVVRRHVPAFTHAGMGARTVFATLGLSRPVLDGVESHSWSGPPCTTPEAEVVRFADRIAYLSRDLDDAVRAGLVSSEDVPSTVANEIGTSLVDQRHALIRGVTDASLATGVVCMASPAAEAMGGLRRWNAATIYESPALVAQGDRQARAVSRAIDVLRARDDQWLAALLRLDDSLLGDPRDELPAEPGHAERVSPPSPARPPHRLWRLRH